MAMFKKVAIVGTGLIGGSIALAIKKQKLAKEIVGVSRHKESLSLALKRGIIQRGSLSLKIIKDAELLILATPVDAIIKKSADIAKINKNCIVIDVGSTKEKIVSTLERIFPNYVGTHPLAGSEKRGVAYSDADLFINSLCILTPTKRTSKSALGAIRNLWGKLGAKVVLLSPKKHDEILSFTSHLPHVIAFSLISSIPNNYLSFASGGLKSSTRISASEAILWRDIFVSNRKNLLRAIKTFEANLSRIKSLIKNNNQTPLERILKQAKNKRDSL